VLVHVVEVGAEVQEVEQCGRITQLRPLNPSLTPRHVGLRETKEERRREEVNYLI
jgi:hypothetical protein